MSVHPLLAECMRIMPDETWEHPLGRAPRAIRKRMYLCVEGAEVRGGETTLWNVYAVERLPKGFDRFALMARAHGAKLPETMEAAAKGLKAAQMKLESGA